MVGGDILGANQFRFDLAGDPAVMRAVGEGRQLRHADFIDDAAYARNITDALNRVVAAGEAVLLTLQVDQQPYLRKAMES